MQRVTKKYGVERIVENMRNHEWAEQAYQIAAEVGKDGYPARRRWAGQNRYDEENIFTESTRFNADRDDRLRQYCREAGVTRYALISYLLRSWMAAWETYRGCGG